MMQYYIFANVFAFHILYSPLTALWNAFIPEQKPGVSTTFFSRGKNYVHIFSNYHLYFVNKRDKKKRIKVN
jgi:hypothetical protein